MKKLMAVGLIAAGVIFWGGFNTVLEATNSMSFCISCHEMRDTVYVEYQNSSHYRSASGVRATCPDCHVPREWTHMLVRKAQATGELFHWAMGSIDTPEKFEAKRHTLAVREWERMRAGDSRECRNCHSFEAMDFHKQSLRASRAMRDVARAREAGKTQKTCIDCHKGIAHKMPDVTANHRKMFAVLLAETATGSFAPGDTVTALESLPLHAEPGASEDLGMVWPGHPIRILALDGGFARIELTGWQREGTSSLLYSRQGQRITLASLDETALQRLIPLRSLTHADTGQTWTETRLDAWIPTTGLTRDPKTLWDYAARMNQDNCTLCHTLYPPEAYSPDNWIGHVNTMKRMTPLTEQEAETLLVYLQLHARDGG